jgi:Zn ribbon nucleic-acid-binding protein
MKVAIITAGQPRFTDDFIKVLNQLKGFDTADLYINLWTSDWADTVEQGIARINKILPNNIVLKKLQMITPPDRVLPTSNRTDNLQWWYDRRVGQIHCLKLAFDLIESPYDLIVRVRPDGSLDSDLDISLLDFTDNDVIFCNRLVGANQTAPNDQFFVGTHRGMEFLCNLYPDFDKYMIEGCPDWETNEHEWALEHVICYYFESNNKPIIRGNFNHDINRVGKSKYTTDKHIHNPIAPDPTSI